jgi:transcriptional regulator with AAA-type ATPase domain
MSHKPLSHEESAEFATLLLGTSAYTIEVEHEEQDSLSPQAPPDQYERFQDVIDFFVRWNTVLPDLDARRIETLILHGELGTGKTRLARLLWMHRAWSLSPDDKRRQIRERLKEVGTSKGSYLRSRSFLESLEQGHRWSHAPLPNLVETLLDSLLFGHRKGAFTGASEDRAGLLTWHDQQKRRADVFLDEVTEVTPAIQSRLLGLLSTGEFSPVGWVDKAKPLVDRLIFASNEQMDDALRTGRFRKDLYHRIASPCLSMRPLRTYNEQSFKELVLGLTKDIGTSLGHPDVRVDDHDIAALHPFLWPGNVRQLEKVLEEFVRSTVSSKISRRPADFAQALEGRFAAGKPTPAERASSVSELAETFCREAFESLRDRPQEGPALTPPGLYEKLVEQRLPRRDVMEAFFRVYNEKRRDPPQGLNVKEWQKRRGG